MIGRHLQAFIISRITQQVTADTSLPFSRLLAH